MAARGIDVPLLNNVINYAFPPAPKLFVHRVGRAARQGRTGTVRKFQKNSAIASHEKFLSCCLSGYYGTVVVDTDLLCLFAATYSVRQPASLGIWRWSIRWGHITHRRRLNGHNRVPFPPRSSCDPPLSSCCVPRGEKWPAVPCLVVYAHPTYVCFLTNFLF